MKFLEVHKTKLCMLAAFVIVVGVAKEHGLAMMPLFGLTATYDWQEDTGTQTGSPLKGTTRTTGVTAVNWKNSGVYADAYGSFPITAGNNSFEKYLFGKFTGTFNLISGGKFAHTAGTLGTGLTLVSKIGTTYATPSTGAVAGSTDITSITAIGSGAAVQFGATGPEAAGKASSSSNATTYSEYLITQLQTTGSASAGDTTSVTLTLRYLEN